MSAVRPERQDRTGGAAAPSARGARLLEIHDVAKAFGATRALRSCSFELLAGEVHAVVGENGSGKSTLVKILSGVHSHDGGQVRVQNRSAPRRISPRVAQRAGVFTVFQEVLVVESQSVLENVWLGADGLFRRRLSDAQKRERARQVLESLLGFVPDLDALAGELTLSQRQACCIARALLRAPRTLILDESTSALDVATRDRLFVLLRRLCDDGVGVVFISHRMDEIEDLADRITVLRSGQSVITLSRAQSSTEVLVRHMTGEERLTAGVPVASVAARSRGSMAMRTEALRLRKSGPLIDTSIYAGELLGLAGLEGHGQDAFLEALRGERCLAGRVLRGEAVLSSPAQALREGVAYVPRDRRAEALFPTLSIRANFAVSTLAQDRRAGLLNDRQTARRMSGYIERLGIRVGSDRHLITTLSGGNQQKVIIARWLAAHPQVLLLNDPTRGVDLNAKRDLYRLLEELAATGVAVVMYSTEVDELVELMDRVLVFREGGVSAELTRSELTRQSLVGAFFSPGGRMHE
jgi:ABC-type sugar transport system ATPase subunit